MANLPSTTSPLSVPQADSAQQEKKTPQQPPITEAEKKQIDPKTSPLIAQQKNTVKTQTLPKKETQDPKEKSLPVAKKPSVPDINLEDLPDQDAGGGIFMKIIILLFFIALLAFIGVCVYYFVIEKRDLESLLSAF